jgi:ATP-binding cassette subfamily B protein
MNLRGDLSLYRRVLQEARPHLAKIAGIFALDLLASPLGLLTPLPLKIAVDSAIAGHPLPGFLQRALPAALTGSRAAALGVAIGLLILLAILAQIQNLASSLLRTYTSEKLVLGFRARMFGHAQRLSLVYHDMKGTADTTYRIQYDAAALQYVPIDGLIPFVTAGFTLVAMIYVTLRLDWQLAAVALAVSPVLFVVSHVCRLRLRAQTREVKKLESAAMGVIQEAFSALRVIKAFGRETHEQLRYIRSSSEGMRARLRLGLAEASYSLMTGLIIAAGTAAALWVAVDHVRAGRLTLGNLLVVMAYLSHLYEPLRTIGKKSSSLQGYLTSAERAFVLLDHTQDVVERPGSRPLASASGTIRFCNVGFAYEEGQPVLNDISFEAPAGARVGIAGRTGAGKTTILSLLTRFYDPRSGQILLDGVDLRDYKLADLRNQFAIVLQEPVLFSTSIAENIAYANPDASQEAIVNAARLADAHDFIMRLPDGYHTQVGERGMRLSGGERQRISLARAFLKNAPILLLDEPTSSVDLKTEATILEAIERLMRGRTTFLVAHRLSTLSGCDIRLELENGRLVAPLSVAPGRARDLIVGVARPELAEHPAVAAWQHLRPPPFDLRGIVVLKPDKKRSAVYRLEGAGPEGSSVIAKRGQAKRLRKEEMIYREVLSHLPFRTLRCYGRVEDPDPRFGWMFLEDAGDKRFSAGNPEHRALAARWLAALHQSSRQIGALQEWLPAFGPAYYRDIVFLARDTIRRGLSNPALSAVDVATLCAILAHCDTVERRWREMEEVFHLMPQSIIHGDFSTKNVRIGVGENKLELLALDWDAAGWGVPASDLSQADAAVYWSAIREHGLALSLDELTRITNVGKLFWALEPITGEAESLSSIWVDNVMRKMRAYHSQLAEALADLDLSGRRVYA